MSHLLRWDSADRELRAVADDATPPTIVDSWHVLDGRIRQLSLHRARFGAACSAWGAQVGTEDGLWRAVRDAMPAVGSWFPRIELIDTGGQSLVQLRVRAAPPLADSAVAWVPDLPDPRRHPQLKGPDLPALLELREHAGIHGASEAILCDEHGFVVEAATSNVLWWDGDTLCLPDRGMPALRGVTEQLIIAEAQRRGIALSYRRRTVAELLRSDLWLTNALHGIRPVTEWRTAHGQPAAAGSTVSQRARQWQSWLGSQRS